METAERKSLEFTAGLWLVGLFGIVTGVVTQQTGLTGGLAMAAISIPSMVVYAYATGRIFAWAAGPLRRRRD